MTSNEVNSMNLRRWAEMARAEGLVLEVRVEGLCVRRLGRLGMRSHLVSYDLLDRAYVPDVLIRSAIEAVTS